MSVTLISRFCLWQWVCPAGSAFLDWLRKACLLLVPDLPPVVALLPGYCFPSIYQLRCHSESINASRKDMSGIFDDLKYLLQAQITYLDYNHGPGTNIGCISSMIMAGLYCCFLP
ncbi:hypothetical protein ASPTUDRAFT_44479 [Aspergillus tubingensis CBS 134.48]|uniref:Uncharacterized protein n=1 Tax=Aspergillus tubingensis (strain CBS 134.48) TaxID=767770 RepID=A0A1L9N1I4_ASPTC|nr:hypothetical protein ASPTUDRAFT_44479 [Aspergillus tubingensis CBS 134.48]